MPSALLTLPFAGVSPRFRAAPRAGAHAAVLGRATVGAGLLLGAFATVRADGETVTLGDGVSLGEGATVHIAHGRYATVVGDRVAVGRNAVVHACTVGDDCVIADDVVILDGSRVGAGVLIEAGSTVFPRSVLDAGHRYAGSPAVKGAPLSLAECRSAGARLRAETSDGLERSGAPGPGPTAGGNFVAATAVLAGAPELAPGASVFFGCRLRAGALAIGENSNVQDNCVAHAPDGEVVIGRNTTLGHNVGMGPCRIGGESLVGMGVVLAAGTVVGDDVLVAAGARTLPGQVLEPGWLWGGRPAKPLKRLDEDRRRMMAGTITHYRAYADAFRDAQAANQMG